MPNCGETECKQGCHILDPDSFTASTHFLGNVKVHNGAATIITQALKELLQAKQADTSSVMALGSDGTTVMTSERGGVTGLLKHVNPMLTNYHCVAHRLALVTSQASQNMPYLVQYQEILIGLFYYFRNSSVHTESLKAIQQVLEEPQLKVREVHEVRMHMYTTSVLVTLVSVLSIHNTPMYRDFNNWISSILLMVPANDFNMSLAVLSEVYVAALLTFSFSTLGHLRGS